MIGNSSFFKMMPAIADINDDDNGASWVYAYSTGQRVINLPTYILQFLNIDIACF